MRIAHFVQRYPPAVGGSEAYFARLSRYLSGQGDDVTVFTTTAVDLEAFWSLRGRRLRPSVTTEDGVRVRRYGLWHAPLQRRALKLLSLVPVWRWQCLTLSCNPIAWRMWADAGRPTERFDLVHATAFPYGWVLMCGLRLARRLGVPFVVTPFVHLGDPHDPHDRTRRAYLSPALRSLLHEADRVFVQTANERAALLERGFPAEKLVLQGMGVDLDGCTGGRRDRARASWGVEAAEVIVGHLANHSVEKGTVDLLKAAQRLQRLDPGRRFRLVLAGPEMPNFRSFWRNYAMKDRVTRLGVLDAEQKRDFFAGIDLFAMPSRSDSFGLVFLEAWANGAPSLAYEAGGVPGVVRHGEDGLLVRCGDLDGLAAALGRLIDDRELRRRLGEAGRARLPRDYRWDDKLALVRRVYAERIGSRGAAAPGVDNALFRLP
jgi:glycosyltransferase involved in cell wall biosynthesis